MTSKGPALPILTEGQVAISQRLSGCHCKGRLQLYSNAESCSSFICAYTPCSGLPFLVFSPTTLAAALRLHLQHAGVRLVELKGSKMPPRIKQHSTATQLQLMAYMSTQTGREKAGKTHSNGLSCYSPEGLSDTWSSWLVCPKHRPALQLLFVSKTGPTVCRLRTKTAVHMHTLASSSVLVKVEALVFCHPQSCWGIARQDSQQACCESLLAKHLCH